MAMQKMVFNKGAIDKAAHQGDAATRYRDARYRKFYKERNFTETLGTWPQMTAIEAAQTSAEINIQIEEAGIVVNDKRPRGVDKITLREALEQHVIQALDPRQRKISEQTADGYASVLRLHVPRWLDMPITNITRKMVNEKIKSMSDIPTTASGW